MQGEMTESMSAFVDEVVDSFVAWDLLRRDV
jgi:hypothetical protein